MRSELTDPHPAGNAALADLAAAIRPDAALRDREVPALMRVGVDAPPAEPVGPDSSRRLRVAVVMPEQRHAAVGPAGPRELGVLPGPEQVHSPVEHGIGRTDRRDGRVAGAG